MLTFVEPNRQANEELGNRPSGWRQGHRPEGFPHQLIGLIASLFIPVSNNSMNMLLFQGIVVFLQSLMKRRPGQKIDDPFTMSMTHANSEIYINNIKTQTFTSYYLTKYSVIASPDWILWLSYGYKSGLNLTYDRWNVGKAQVNSWWKGNGTIPVNYYPSNNHVFWHYGWQNN